MSDDDNRNGTNPRLYERMSTPDLAHEFAGIAGSVEQQIIDALAGRLVAKAGDGPPPKKFLGLTSAGWIKISAGLIATVGGAAITWVVMVRDTLKDLTNEIDQHKSLPAHQETAEDLGKLNVRVMGVENAVHDIGTKQQQVVEGIEELKQENVSALKDELKDLRQQNRRLRNQ